MLNMYTSIADSPIKPVQQGGFSYTGPNIQGVTRRPTVIRVPSKTDKCEYVCYYMRFYPDVIC